MAPFGRGAAAAGPLLPLGLAVAGVAGAFAVAALLVLSSGKNPLVAYWSLAAGALGSWDRVAIGLNKATPLLLTAVGVALCFRANVVNIGGEGQIAVGGLAATWVALAFPKTPAPVVIPLAIVAGAVAGAGWAGLAAVVRLTRGVHEVIVTLLLNFVGVLLVGEALHGSLGESGAGFPQSPLFPPETWLPRLLPGTDLHVGILVALAAVAAGHLLLWRTPFGFRLRLLGASPSAATYAGVSLPRSFVSVMAIAGALAGLAGALEVLGVHYRLIEGFSHGFGFNAVAVALLGALTPLGVLPAALFFGFLETGAQAMQRAMAVPSPLVGVIQGLTLVFVLCAMALGGRRRRV